MHRMPQINNMLQNELAKLISLHLEMPNVLVTVSYVKCSPNLKEASIGLSVLPPKLSGTVLKRLNKLNAVFSASLKKKSRLRKIPHFYWQIDSTEKNAAEIEKILNKIKRQAK